MPNSPPGIGPGGFPGGQGPTPNRVNIRWPFFGPNPRLVRANTTNARVSQVAIEALISETSGARVTQVAVEVLVPSWPRLPRIPSHTTLYALTLQGNIVVPFIASATVVHAPTLGATITVPFIGSSTTLFTPAVQGYVTVPFVSSQTTLYALVVQGYVAVPFIGSSTTLFTPAVQGYVTVPFIGSSTTLFTPTLSSPTSDVDVPFIASATSLYQLALTPIAVPSGELVLTGDDVAGYFVPATEGIIHLSADAPTIPGAIQATSGVLSLTAAALVQGGPISLSTSGVLRLAASAPVPITAIKPVSGVLRLRGDAPQVLPTAAQSGKLVLAASGPSVIPTAADSGRLLLATGVSPNVWPLQATSGVLRLLGGTEAISSAGILLQGSGILVLRSTTPIITPLTEPTEPPPPEVGALTVGGVR